MGDRDLRSMDERCVNWLELAGVCSHRGEQAVDLIYRGGYNGGIQGRPAVLAFAAYSQHLG